MGVDQQLKLLQNNLTLVTLGPKESQSNWRMILILFDVRLHIKKQCRTSHQLWSYARRICVQLGLLMYIEICATENKRNP